MSNNTRFRINDMKSRLFTLPLLTAILFGLLAVSCSKEQKLLDVIPSSVDIVGSVRLKSVLDKAGCRYENDAAVVPAGMDAPERLTAIVNLIGCMDASGVCNVDETYWGQSGEGKFFAVLSVSDRKKFKEATAPEINWADETGGYTCGKVGTMAVLLDDERVWFTTEKPSEAVKVIEGLMDDAKKSAIGAMTGLVQLLAEDNLLNIAARQGNAEKNKKGAKGENPNLEVKWATLTLNVNDNKLVGNSSMIEADGKPVAVAGMQEINPAVLAYVPGNFNIALGFGITPEFDWSVLTAAIGTFGGFQTQGMISAVIPYLQSVDGTVLFAAGPATPEAYTDPDFGNWQFIAMVHLPQQKINDVMGMMRSSMFMAGVSPKDVGNGVMMIPQYGMNIYLGNVDGYLAVSNFPFESGRQNSLAPVFGGKVGALSFSLPTLKVLGGGMPDYGLGVKVQMNPDNAVGEINLTGTDRPILEVLLEALV